MKKSMILLGLITSFSMLSFGQTWQQTWSDMSKEEKLAQIKSFRASNQKYLKDSLGMTSQQLHQIDSVNSVFWKGLRPIENGSGTDDQKFDKAKELASKRAVALDNIMGEGKHNQFSQYLERQLKKKFE
jgi:hypothetical protein